MNDTHTHTVRRAYVDELLARQAAILVVLDLVEFIYQVGSEDAFGNRPDAQARALRQVMR